MSKALLKSKYIIYYVSLLGTARFAFYKSVLFGANHVIGNYNSMAVNILLHHF